MFMMIQENHQNVQEKNMLNAASLVLDHQNLKNNFTKSTFGCGSLSPVSFNSAFNLFKQKQNNSAMFPNGIANQKVTNLCPSVTNSNGKHVTKNVSDDEINNIENRDMNEMSETYDDYEIMNEENESDSSSSYYHESKLYNKMFYHQNQISTLKCKYFESPISQSQIQYDCTAPIARNTPENNEVREIEYRLSKVASFTVDGKELICLPQAFEMFLKNLVGGLHTVYTKLKRLDIVPIVCNVEQVRHLMKFQFSMSYLILKLLG